MSALAKPHEAMKGRWVMQDDLEDLLTEEIHKFIHGSSSILVDLSN
jgi:hypothetical protein